MKEFKDDNGDVIKFVNIHTVDSSQKCHDSNAKDIVKRVDENHIFCMIKIKKRQQRFL